MRKSQCACAVPHSLEHGRMSKLRSLSVELITHMEKERRQNRREKSIGD